MKKLVLAAALFIAAGSTAVFAHPISNPGEVEIQSLQKDFQPIDVNELPEAVVNALKSAFADSTIKEAAIQMEENGTKLYKVTLAGADGAETEVMINEAGEIQK